MKRTNVATIKSFVTQQPDSLCNRLFIVHWNICRQQNNRRQSDKIFVKCIICLSCFALHWLYDKLYLFQYTCILHLPFILFGIRQVTVHAEYRKCYGFCCRFCMCVRPLYEPFTKIRLDFENFVVTFSLKFYWNFVRSYSTFREWKFIPIQGKF